MIRIRTDDSLFIVSNKTLEQYPDSDLYKATFSDIKNDYIYVDKKDDIITLYIDADPDTIKIILKMLRGGDDIDMEMYFRDKLLRSTLKKLNLDLFQSKEETENKKSNLLSISTPEINNIDQKSEEKLKRKIKPKIVTL